MTKMNPLFTKVPFIPLPRENSQQNFGNSDLYKHLINSLDDLTII